MNAVPPQSPPEPEYTNAGPERLPLRWGVILTAALVAGLVAFVFAGPLAALGASPGVIGMLHTVMA